MAMAPDNDPQTPAAVPSWEEHNNAYLAGVLRGLRNRLIELARAEHGAPGLTIPGAPAVEHQAVLAPSPAAAEPASLSRRRRFWHRHKAEALVAATTATPAPASPPPQAAIVGPSPFDVVLTGGAAAEPHEAEAVSTSEAAMPAPAIQELAERVGLTAFERDVLLLAASPELDPHIAELCALVQGREGAGPSFGLALRLFENPEWEALAPHRPLRRLQLVTLGVRAESVVHARLIADERVVNLLKGLDHIDERLVELLAPMAAGSADQAVARSHAQTIETITGRARAAGGDRVIVSLTGPHVVSKRIVAQQVAAELGAYAVRLPVSSLPPPGAELNTLIRLWERDSLLSPLALYLDASDPGGEAGTEATVAARRLLSRVNGLIFIDSREPWVGLEGTALVAEVPNPTAHEQQAAWEDALPAAQASISADLAAQFDLDPLTIRGLTKTGAPDVGKLWEEVRISTRPSLDLLGRRAQMPVAPHVLVLPDEVLEQLERIREQVRHRARVYNDWGLAARMSRGLGISALFAGESGTGKTLAAEVIAADLGLDLYRIDLSGVVSKYIGETEKNLRRVFDAAEQGGTILCFDEADALFGKRSEVKDSHDRYANIEVNYLLQRMEEYRGLAILTTNMKGALDHAFTRRIRFVVDFPFPGVQDRERLWRGAFLPSLSTDQLDFARLARLTLSGGGIHNVAVNATFAAAATPDQAVTMPMVLAAARLEYRKNDLPVNEAAFTWDDAGVAGRLPAGAQLR
jgi:hypothetical protein